MLFVSSGFPDQRRGKSKVGDFGRAVSRILSAPKLLGGENHLSQQPVPGTSPPESGGGAGRSGVPYLALHPMGFSVPPRLRLERWALTPPFHPYRRFLRTAGGIFSVALSVGTPRGVTARVYLPVSRLSAASASYAASRPAVFGLSSPVPFCGTEAILRPSKISGNIAEVGGITSYSGLGLDFL